VGVIPPKIQGEMSTVGSVSHHWMWGTKRRLEQLMMHHGLRSVSNRYRARKTVLLHM